MANSITFRTDVKSPREALADWESSSRVLRDGQIAIAVMPDGSVRLKSGDVLVLDGGSVA